MVKFVEIYNLPKLNQEKSEDLNKQITTNETEAVIKEKKKTPNKQKAWKGHLTDEFCQILKEEIPPIFIKLFQKIQKEGRFPSSFHDSSIILIPKPGKDNT